MLLKSFFYLFNSQLAVLAYSPISGFFASSASSVLKRVFGKRMKIFDLQIIAKDIYYQHSCTISLDEHYNIKC